MGYLREEIKAGIIVLTSLILLSGFVILIGGSQLFEKLDLYYVKVMNAAGLEEGSQVRLGGVKVGRVLSIKPPVSYGEPIVVTIGIKKGVVLYKGTRASISQVGFVGDIYLLLSVDKTTTGEYKAGDTIPSEEQVQLGLLMARLDSISQSVDGLIKDIQVLFAPENRKEIEKLLKNANAAIVSGSSDISKVTVAIRSASAKLENLLTEIEGLVKDNREEVSHLIRQARKGIEDADTMIRAIEAAAKTMDGTLKTADRAIDLQSQNIDILINTLNRSVEDIREAIHEIKQKPWGIVYKEEKGKE